MRSLGLFLILVLMSACGNDGAHHSHAGGGNQAVRDAGFLLCAEVKALAEGVMERRQNGVSLPLMLASVDRSAPAGWARSAARGMIVEAYEVPQQTSLLLKGSAVETFSRKKYLECLRENRLSG